MAISPHHEVATLRTCFRFKSWHLSEGPRTCLSPRLAASCECGGVRCTGPWNGMQVVVIVELLRKRPYPWSSPFCRGWKFCISWWPGRICTWSRCIQAWARSSWYSLPSFWRLVWSDLRIPSTSYHIFSFPGQRASPYLSYTETLCALCASSLSSSRFS